jgi:hypothetical protein
MKMGTKSGVLWMLILKHKFKNQMTGMCHMSLSLFSVSVFLNGKFNVTGVF